MRFRLLPLFLLAVMLGCQVNAPTDSDQTTSPPPGAKHLPDAIQTPPMQSGIVTRGEDTFAAINGDGTYIQVAGVNTFEWCSYVLGQGPFPDFDFIDFQYVNLPDAQRFLANMVGEVQIEVWPVPTSCVSVVDGAQPIASGTATLRYVDNDVVPDGPNVNVWGWTVQGQLSGSDGQLYNYSSTFKFQFCVQDGCTANRVVAATIQLTPVTN